VLGLRHHLVGQEMEAVLTLEAVFAGLVVAASHGSLAEEKRNRAMRVAGNCHNRSFLVVATEAIVFVLLESEVVRIFCFVWEEEAEVCYTVGEPFAVLGYVQRAQWSNSRAEGFRPSQFFFLALRKQAGNRD